MATTLQDQNRAKFLELRASGKSVAEARNATYWPTPVVADQTPPVSTTPTTPAPVNPAPLAPQPIVNAPVDQTTGLSKPLEPVAQNTQNPTPAPTPTPVTTVTAEVKPPEPVKTEVASTTTQTPFQQAQAESEKIKAQNEAILAQNKQKADLATQERQTIAQETAKANTPVNQKDIVTALISGQSVPVQKTMAYNNAVVQANEYKKFVGMTSTQLLDNLKQWQIGTEMSSLLANNPQFIKAKAEQEKIQKTDSINRAVQIATNVISGKETPVVNDLANIEAKYSAPIWTNAQAYEQWVVQNPDVISAWLQVKQLAKNIADVTTTYNQALKDLKSQYPDMPASALLTLMGSRTNDTKTLLDSYINAQTTAKGDFDLAMKMAEWHYTATAADIAQENILKNEQAKLQMTADFQKKQAEQALNDPATAIKSVMDEMAKIGVSSTESLQTKIQKAKDYIAKWGTLAGYIDEMKKLYTDKPEYQAYLAKQKWEGISYQTIWDKVYRKNADWSLTETNINPKSTPEAKAPEWKQDASGNWYNANASTSPAVQTSQLSPTAISQISTRLQGNNVQCGMVTNDYNSKYFPDAPKMWDSYESKIATVNTIGVAPVPQVWGNFVMDTGTSTGHTGIVTSVDLANGTFTATDANKSGSKNGWPVQTSTYKISPKVTFSNAPVWQVTSKVTPLTQVAIQTKSLSWTPSEQSKQLEELQKLWVLDKWEGNANLYKAKVDVKQEMPNLITGYDAFERAKAIIDKHKQKWDLDEMLGSYDANQERLKAKTGAFTDTEFQNDFNTLDQVFGKELSQYMNKISGATVGDKEVERLKRQVPNLDMSESEFDTALSAYEDSLKNANRFFLNEYWFTDMDTARKVLLGNWTSQSNTTPVNVQSIIDEWNNR